MCANYFKEMVYDEIKEASLLKTSDGKKPTGCPACKDGICSDTELGCDGCYENFMKLNFQI